MKNNIRKLLFIVMIGATITSCASSPSQDMTPAEVAQSLGYSKVIPVTEVPALATFTMESINSRTAVMGGRFGVRYLIAFSRNCPAIGFGNIFDTTSIAGQMDTEDSIIVDSETYCPISEIYILEK